MLQCIVTKDFVSLGPYEYFLQKVLAPILQAIHAVAVCGGLITAVQWSVWAVKFVKKMLKTCFKTSAPEPNFSPEMLLELMGDSIPDPEIAISGKRITQGVRYTKGSTCSEDKVELSPPLTRI